MARITVVDENDNVTGAANRDEARTRGLRHRIVRVFLLNHKGEVLLQKRNRLLLDTPGKWDQSVGGHVDEGEDYITAARRETFEELGIRLDKFKEIGKFYIEREGPGGLIRRFQTVFIAHWSGQLHHAELEVAEVRWLPISEIDKWLQTSPNDFTTNFARAFSLLKQALPE